MVDISAPQLTSVRRWPAATPETDPADIEPESPYVDRFWMPVIGPTAVALARLLMRLVETSDQAVEVNMRAIAAQLGLHPASGSDELWVAIDQLRDAGITTFENGTLLVDAPFRRLGPHHAAVLPPSLRAEHSRWTTGSDEQPERVERPPGPPSARIVNLASAVEEILTDHRLSSAQLATRWQQVVRIAEEARDEAVLDAAEPDLETTLAEAQLAAQELSEVIWATQHVILTHGRLPDAHRLSLATAAASLIDWMVAEFPNGTHSSWVLDLPDI